MSNQSPLTIDSPRIKQTPKKGVITNQIILIALPSACITAIRVVASFSGPLKYIKQNKKSLTVISLRFGTISPSAAAEVSKLMP